MSKVLVSESNLQDIANSIRAKNGSQETYTPSQMSEAIDEIQTGTASEYNAIIDGTSLTYNTSSANNAHTLNKMVKEVPIIEGRNWSTAAYLFYNCEKLEKIGGILLGENVSSASYMFGNCQAIKEIPFFDTSMLTYTNGMFYECRELLNIPQIDISKSTTIDQAFMNCRKIKTMPNLNTESCTVMSQAFRNCYELVTLPILNTSKVTSLYNTFSSCSKLSDESLNNILAMCIGATSYTGTKTLKYMGLSSSQATTCQNLSNYQAFLEAGWTTGY